MRDFTHSWRCAGCDKVYDLVTRIPEEDIKRSFNAAPLIATQKMMTERVAAERHAKNGCKRPV